MESLIDINYFRYGNIQLPYVNIQSWINTPSDSTINDEQLELERYIAIYQKEYLTKIFGSNTIPDEETIKSLLVNEELLTSPIAMYVYCRIIPYYQTKATPSGNIAFNNTNSTNVEVRPLIDLIWNEMYPINVQIRVELERLKLEESYKIDLTDRKVLAMFKPQTFL